MWVITPLQPIISGRRKGPAGLFPWFRGAKIYDFLRTKWIPPCCSSKWGDLIELKLWVYHRRGCFKRSAAEYSNWIRSHWNLWRTQLHTPQENPRFTKTESDKQERTINTIDYKLLIFFFLPSFIHSLSLLFSYPNTPINQPLKIQGQRGSELRGKKHERTDSVLLLPILSLSRGVKLCWQRREALTDGEIEVLI